MEESLLLVARPSRWIAWKYYLLSFLIVPLFYALVERHRLKFMVYSDRIVLEQGILSKDMKVIFIEDIRTIDVRQTFVQRLLKIGDIMIATAGTSDYEDVVRGMPDPAGIKDLIMARRTAEDTIPVEEGAGEKRFKWLEEDDEDW